MPHFPSAAAFSIVQALKSLPAQERKAACVDAIAMLAEQEQRELEAELLVRAGFIEEVSPEEFERLTGQKLPEGDPDPPYLPPL
jgi:hypothetical protein